MNGRSHTNHHGSESGSARLGSGSAAVVLRGISRTEQRGREQGSGFEHGASQEEVDAALADLEPVELVFQPSAASPESTIAPSAIAFKEAVEERSGGKITIDTVWGQAIAGYGEVDDALADGRVDIAFTIPMYDPSTYDAIDQMVSATVNLPSSPLEGELVSNGVLLEMGWKYEEILADFADQGLAPLVPVAMSGEVYFVCNSPGTSSEDWGGRQVRIGNAAQEQLVSGIGASGVSLEYVETYEALQRNTVDCTIINAGGADEGGYLEVAPHVSYSSKNSLHRGPGAYVAGTDVQALPVAYQQIIFDAMEPMLATSLQESLGSKTAVSQAAQENDGVIEEVDEETASMIASVAEEQNSEVAESGLLGDNPQQDIEELVTEWTAAVQELGYEDEGTLANINEWYDSEADYADIAERYYSDILLGHRPQ